MDVCGISFVFLWFVEAKCRSPEVILCLFSAAELWMMGGFYLSAYVNLSDQGDTQRDIGFGQLLRFFMFFAVFYIPILPLLFYIGLGMMVELKELPEQLKDFRVQDAKCFCCSCHHRHPETAEVLPCDRELMSLAIDYASIFKCCLDFLE